MRIDDPLSNPEQGGLCLWTDEHLSGQILTIAIVLEVGKKVKLLPRLEVGLMIWSSKLWLGQHRERRDAKEKDWAAKRA